jgi:hypothetical protein
MRARFEVFMTEKINIFWIMALHSWVVNTHVLEEHTASTFREDKAECSSKMLVPTYETAG